MKGKWSHKQFTECDLNWDHFVLNHVQQHFSWHDTSFVEFEWKQVLFFINRIIFIEIKLIGHDFMRWEIQLSISTASLSNHGSTE